MKPKILIFAMLCSLGIQAQTNSDLSIFDNLVGRTWVANGTWGDGTIFKQEITFAFDLNNSILRSETNGFVDDKKTAWGRRNHGVRQLDKTSGKIQFWEYDVFGGITQGRVSNKNDNIYYQYEYGEGSDRMTLTDGWEKINANEYVFKVGVFEDGKWQTTFLNTKFIALPVYSGDRQDLDKILAKTRLFSKTYMKGDHIGLSEFYTINGKIMPGGSKIIEGRTAIAARWKLSEGSRILDHQVHPEKSEIIGDRAIDYGYYEGKSQAADGKIYPFKGKYVITWKKVDDIWLIDVDIWNQVE